MSEVDPVDESSPRRISLPILVLWGLSPAIMMTLLSLAVKVMPTNDPSLFILVQLVVAPIVLLVWAIWIVLQTRWNGGVKFIAGMFFLGIAYLVNTVIAAGACSVINPPFNMH